MNELDKEVRHSVTKNEILLQAIGLSGKEIWQFWLDSARANNISYRDAQEEIAKYYASIADPQVTKIFIPKHIITASYNIVVKYNQKTGRKHSRQKYRGSYVELEPHPSS
jgi:hypothetical protein